jgi:hypothetical protein
VPDLLGRGLVWFCVELQSVSGHQGFPFVYQVPFDDQLALFSLFGIDLMNLNELLVVLGPGGSGLDGSRSQEVQVTWRGASVEVKGFIKGEAGTAGNDRHNLFGLLEGGFKLYRGGVPSFEETGPHLRHQGFERSRCFKVQRPVAAEILIVRLLRLERGRSFGQTAQTEPRECGKPEEQERPELLAISNCTKCIHQFSFENKYSFSSQGQPSRRRLQEIFGEC